MRTCLLSRQASKRESFEFFPLLLLSTQFYTCMTRPLTKQATFILKHCTKVVVTLATLCSVASARARAEHGVAAAHQRVRGVPRAAGDQQHIRVRG